MKYTFLILILLSLSVPVYSDDWRCYDRGCYLEVRTSASWSDARTDCITKGGDLASIHSEEENLFIRGITPRQYGFWIGLSYIHTQGTWVWSDGSDFDFTYWYPGEPNSGSSYDCAFFDNYVTYWYDYPCSWIRYYICKINNDECMSSPCMNGTCEESINGFRCICVPGYTGSLCDLEINECLSSPCINGSCEDLINGFRCTCIPGFTGTHCDLEINECDYNHCFHGNCTDHLNNYTCECDPGYTGYNCEQNINDCEDSPCMHGVCEDLVDAFMCNCYPGYSGVYCEHDQQVSILSRLQFDIVPIVVPFCLLVLVLLTAITCLAIALRISRRRLNVKENAVQPFNERSEDGA